MAVEVERVRRRRLRRRHAAQLTGGMIGSLAVALAVTNGLPGPFGDRDGQRLSAPDATARDFIVSGSVENVEPGVPSSLFLRITNPNRSDISVTELGVIPGDGSDSCPASNLVVAPFGGPVLVPGDGEASVELAVSIRAGAPGACSGATFPLRYSGRAEQA